MSNPIYEDPKIDWRFKGLLQSCDSAWSTKERLLMSGKILRTDSGMREFWRDTPPTDEEKAAARAEQDRKGFGSHCHCCNRYFRIPTEYASIEETGVCKTCALFEEGKFPGVAVTRLPTLEEALDTPTDQVRFGEAFVMKQALKEER